MVRVAGAHRGRLVIVLGISVVLFLAELVVGFLANSLALLADAGYVFADVASSGLALAAISLAARPATGRRTFGFYRFEILAAVLTRCCCSPSPATCLSKPGGA